MHSYSDKEILKMIGSGKEQISDQALRYLYKQYYGLIEQLVTKNNGSAADAQDIFQDGLIAFYNQVRSGKLNLTCTIKTYLYSICRNLWLMRLKKAQRTTALSEKEEFIEVGAGVIKKIESTEQSSMVAKLLDKLGGDCKKVLIYFYFERLKMAQIVELMGYKNAQIAKNKRLRCMNRLRKMVKDQPSLAKYFG